MFRLFLQPAVLVFFDDKVTVLGAVTLMMMIMIMMMMMGILMGLEMMMITPNLKP